MNIDTLTLADLVATREPTNEEIQAIGIAEGVSALVAAILVPELASDS